MKIGRALLKERKNRGFQKWLAQSLEVTPQTLRNWRRMAERESQPKRGRPRYTADLRKSARALVAGELALQGYPGWRPVAKALPDLPTRLVQMCVREIKKERRKQKDARIKGSRTTVEVLAREAVWTIDGTQSKDDQGSSIDSQVLKDRGSLAYRAVQSGGPATASDITSLLGEMGALPLVLGMDNARIYTGKETAGWLADHKIIALRSLPRTPQHNGAIEIGIRALKDAARQSGASLAAVAKQINEFRLRGSKGFKASTVLDAELPVAYDFVDREVFYDKCMARLRRVEEAPMECRAKRMLEREVIYATLEEYGLIKRTGGEGSRWRVEGKNFL